MFNQYEDMEEIAAHEAETDFEKNIEEAQLIRDSYPHDSVRDQAIKFLDRYGYAIPGDTFEKANDAYVANVIDIRSGGKITHKQLGVIRNLAADFNLDISGECSAMFNCTVPHLSKPQAYDLIQHLRAKGRAMTPARVAA